LKRHIVATTGWILGVTAPWLLLASKGPVASFGAWIAVGFVMSVNLWRKQPANYVSAQYATSLGLGAAAIVSVFFASLQFLSFDSYLSCCVSPSVAGETVANLRQRNLFSSLIVIGLLAAIFLYKEMLYVNELSVKHHGLPVLILGLIWLALGNAMSGSRTGAIQWLLALSLTWVWRGDCKNAVRWLVVWSLVAFGLWILVMPWIAEWVGNSSAGLLGRANDPNAFSRIALWSNVIELIAQKPWLGHGWRSLAYAHYSTEFSGTRFMEMLDNAHNLPLHLAVELGLPVAIAFCGLVGWLIWKNKPWAEVRSDRQLAWGILMVIGIHSMLEYPLWYGPFFMTTLICIGILCGDVWRNWLLARTKYARRAINLGIKAFAVLLLAFTAFAAFDYHRVSQIYLQAEERSSWYADDPLGAAKKSVLFQSHAKFAELQITPLSAETAARVLALSSELVHWSPEPRIIEKLIESSVMMGLDDVAAFHLKRYKVAYPAAYALWSQRAL
jgi:O-antigen ligase